MTKKNATSVIAAKKKSTRITSGRKTAAETIVENDVAEKTRLMTDVASIRKPVGIQSEASGSLKKPGSG